MNYYIFIVINIVKKIIYYWKKKLFYRFFSLFNMLILNLFYLFIEFSFIFLSLRCDLIENKDFF